jgi:hypothetical protein
MNEKLTDFMDTMSAQVTTIVRDSSSSSSPLPLTDNSPNSESHQGYQLFTWGGSMGRYTPQDFIFPATTVKILWDLWHYGHAGRGIRPYKLLRDTNHYCEVNKGKRSPLLSKATKVMNLLEEIIYSNRMLPEETDISSLSKEASDELFHKSFPILIENVYGTTTPIRPLELIYTSVANMAYKKTAK